MSEERNAPVAADGEDTGVVLAALQGDKTYLKDADDKAPADDAADDQASGDDAAAEPAAEGEGDKPKPRQTAQERIDELTRARRESDREAAHWKRIAQEGAPKDEPKPAEPAEDKEPDPADFQYGETDPGYIRALGAYSAEQKFNELERKREQRTLAQATEQTWKERAETFANATPDFYERIDDPKLQISPAMADAIRASDLGPQVAYHLASNPDEARRIAGMNALASVMEIGRIAARFDTKAGPPPKPASDAPPPPPQLRGGGGRFKVDPSTDSFADFEAAYVNK